MNEIVKVHNNLTDLTLKNFNAVEMDILLEICYEVSEQGTAEVTLTFNQIKQMANISDHNKTWFVKTLRSTNKKLMQLNMSIINPDNSNEIVDFVLFPEFAVNEKEEYLRVQVAQKFVYLLNDLTKNYTRLELQESMSLRSSYSKQIYKQLSKFRDTGWWELDVDDFRKYLDIPKCYKQSHIDTMVLNTSLTELAPFFSNLKIEKIFNSNGKPGRPKVSGYRFSFDVKEKSIKQKISSETGIAAATGYEESARYCPVCHRKVFEKTVIDSYTGESYKIWGHPDFRTGKCSWSTFDYQLCLTQEILEKIGKSKSRPTVEQMMNIKNLNALAESTFKKGK